MTYRGYSVLAILALLSVAGAFAAVALDAAGVWARGSELGLTLAVGSVTLAVLSVLDDVI